jgi:hypothetical protein
MGSLWHGFVHFILNYNYIWIIGHCYYCYNYNVVLWLFMVIIWWYGDNDPYVNIYQYPDLIFKYYDW